MQVSIIMRHLTTVVMVMNKLSLIIMTDKDHPLFVHILFQKEPLCKTNEPIIARSTPHVDNCESPFGDFSSLQNSFLL